jgi:hypothetical protein
MNSPIVLSDPIQTQVYSMSRNNQKLLTMGEVAKLVGTILPGNRGGQAKTRKQKKRKNQNRNSAMSQAVTAPSVGGAITRLNYRGPRMVQRGDSTFITHTEVIATLNQAAGGAFAGANASLMPSNIGWLAGPSASFSKWRWVQLRFIYIPAVATSTAGKMAMGLSYDFSDTVASSLPQIQQMYHAVAAPIWAGFEGTSLLAQHGIRPTVGSVVVEADVARFGAAWYKWMAITPWNALGGPEKSVYSPGQLVMGTANGNAVNGVGDVYVQYVVELIEPFVATLN